MRFFLCPSAGLRIERLLFDEASRLDRWWHVHASFVGSTTLPAHSDTTST